MKNKQKLKIKTDKLNLKKSINQKGEVNEHTRTPCSFVSFLLLI